METTGAATRKSEGTRNQFENQFGKKADGRVDNRRRAARRKVDLKNWREDWRIAMRKRHKNLSNSNGLQQTSRGVSDSINLCKAAESVNMLYVYVQRKITKIKAERPKL